MGRIDLLQPGERLPAAGGRELNAVIDAFNAMLTRLERERRASSTRVLGEQEDERRLIARELHDQVGQGLTALLLQLKDAAAESSGSALASIAEAQGIARANLDEVRRIARRLRPTVLDDLGLPYALAALADAAEDQGLTVVRDIREDTPRISATAELALYRIAQEALTNVARHAAASAVELVLRRADAGAAVRLEINDDGRGMLYAVEVEAGGIRGMRERALAVGADLTVATRPGGGTSVSVVVPEAQ
jgi:two-component system sensor histidine kinase UhpB